MSFGLNIHHIFAKDVLQEYAQQLDEIFGGAENHPFNLDADFHRIAILSDRAFAPILQHLKTGESLRQRPNTAPSSMSIGVLRMPPCSSVADRSTA
jgi:hypothetical protein